MKAKYVQNKLLPEVGNHLDLPKGCQEIARLRDTLNYNDLYLFLKHGSYLVIATVDDRKALGDPRYGVDQFESPLELLVWFPQCLEGFITPSSQGGLHPGAMTTQDQNVGGEMLCVQRAMDAGNNQSGYVIVNRSRPSRLYHGYSPSEITFPENFLYEGGLLSLMKTLGDKYQRGEL